VEGASGDRTVPLNATSDFGAPGQCDLVILATKASGVGPAAAAMEPLLGENTLILTIQNGLGAAERISEFRSPDNILIGVAGGFGASMIRGDYQYVVELITPYCSQGLQECRCTGSLGRGHIQG